MSENGMTMNDSVYKPMTADFADKRALLKRFCTAPTALRKQFMAIASLQGFVRNHTMDQSRDGAFFGCCVADLRGRGVPESNIKTFASKLLMLPSDELDFLVVVAMELEKGRVSYVPEFTAQIERLLESSPETVQ